MGSLKGFYTRGQNNSDTEQEPLRSITSSLDQCNCIRTSRLWGLVLILRALVGP